MTPDEATRLMAALVMVGVAISDLEVLAHPAQLRPAGFYSWDVLRTMRGWTAQGRAAQAAERLLSTPAVLVLFGLQLVAAVLTIAGVGPMGVWVAVALAVNLLFHLRNHYGLDGSDQMQTIVLAGLAVYAVAPGPVARTAALYFIAGQAVLSYLTAGVAKLISPTWRSGAAVGAILNTRSYGGPTCAAVAHRWPVLSTSGSRATLVFECGMPLLVFVSPTACLVFVVAAVVFHGFIAMTMGLNIFFWSFIATMPALYLLSTHVSLASVL